MPRLHDENAPAPERRAPKPPVDPVAGPHIYRLRYDNREDEVIEAESAIDAVDLREGGRLARLPYQITDETEMGAWIARRLATHNGG